MHKRMMQLCFLSIWISPHGLAKSFQPTGLEKQHASFSAGCALGHPSPHWSSLGWLPYSDVSSAKMMMIGAFQVSAFSLGYCGCLNLTTVHIIPLPVCISYVCMLDMQ